MVVHQKMTICGHSEEAVGMPQGLGKHQGW